MYICMNWSHASKFFGLAFMHSSSALCSPTQTGLRCSWADDILTWIEAACRAIHKGSQSVIRE